jgi:hypothetical protein
MSTVTVAESPDATPAAPLYVGVLSLVTPATGESRDRAGAVVSTVKVLTLLSDVLPGESDCSARAV